MKKAVLFMSLIAILVSCKSNKEKEESITTVDSSRVSLDWQGTYSGTLPCADCAGIDYTLILKNDDTYSLSRVYKVTPEENFISKGSFTWNEKGNVITLDESGNEGVFMFKVGENKLLALDQQGKEIKGELANNYVLAKLNTDFIGKHWKLVELMGNPIETAEGKKEAFIVFSEDGRVNGNFGCNSFSGTYTLRIGDRISFSQMASTMMMCLDMSIESKFSEVLNMADNYNFDGEKFVLNRARMAPLARFEAVEIQ